MPGEEEKSLCRLLSPYFLRKFHSRKISYNNNYLPYCFWKPWLCKVHTALWCLENILHEFVIIKRKQPKYLNRAFCPSNCYWLESMMENSSWWPRFKSIYEHLFAKTVNQKNWMYGCWRMHQVFLLSTRQIQHVPSRIHQGHGVKRWMTREKGEEKTWVRSSLCTYRYRTCDSLTSK
jgi:hypothetical protein